MIKIIRFFLGYVVFSVKGKSPERFINLALKKGVRLFDVKKKKGILYCSTLVSEYCALRKVAKKALTKIKIEEKRGVPFFVRQYKKRKGFFLGAIFFWIILHFLSIYVWSIDINGIESIDKNEFNKLIKELGVSVGTLKSEIDTPMIEKKIMTYFSNVSWVSANIKGSKLTFDLKERVTPPKIIPKITPCNVKASNEGQIIRLEIYEGNSEIKCGDAVVKGQLLISGFVEDAFGTCTAKHADGKVFAITKHELKKEVNLCQTEKQKTGKTVVRKRVKFFGLELPITLVPAPKKDYEKEIKINDIKILGVSLPIGYYEEVWSQVYDKKVTLSDKDAILKANKDLEEDEQNLLKEMKVISKEKKEKIENGKAIVVINYVCEENIAEQEEIVLED